MEKYWASEEDGIAEKIMDKVEQQRKFLLQTDRIHNLRKSYDTFYGSPNIQTIDQSLQVMHINHYANLVRHVLVDVTSQRPAWEARAINTDLESQADTQLAAGLLDYYMREKHIETILNEAVEKCLFLLEGWVSCGWDVNAGEVHAMNPDDGRPIKTGDLLIEAHALLDVTRDVRRKGIDHEWFIIRTQENKWNIAAQYPELAEKIIGLTSDNKDAQQFELNHKDIAAAIEVETDMIDVYTLRHDKTPALPEGRMVKCLSGDIKLFDGPLPYKRLYVFPVCSSKKLETSFGHSYLMDLLPTCDAFNATVSAILTNQAANAIQNFQCPKGAAPNVVKVESGLNVWEFDPKAGKMEPMDLLRTAPEVFKFAEFLQGQSELVAGVSQISRGNAPAAMSGTAMALLAQQSIQFSSGVQLSRTQLQENVGSAIIEILESYATVPRVAQIVGKSKRAQMKTFKGSDLKGISRVICDTANPLTKTSAGRVEIANQLLAAPGMIKTPEQYIGVLTTGNLEPLYEHEQSTLNLMRAENEQLMNGIAVKALLVDDHPMHILEHSCVLNSPEARENVQIVQTTLDHIQEHLDIGRSMPPELAAMLKQQSIFQPPQPPMPDPSQAPAPGGAPPEGMPQVMDNQNPITQEAGRAGLPKPAEPPQIGGMQ